MKEIKIEFLVQGSEDDPYEVVFIKKGTNIQAFCTCKAGENGMYCKHRFAILLGYDSKVVSKNSKLVSELARWLPGSDIEASMRTVFDMENELETAKKRLSAAKKALAIAMRT